MISKYASLFEQLKGVVENPSGSGPGRLISLMEGGYEVTTKVQGLALCVGQHIDALRRDKITDEIFV